MSVVIWGSVLRDANTCRRGESSLFRKELAVPVATQWVERVSKQQSIAN